ARAYIGSIYENKGAYYTGGSRALEIYAASDDIEEAGAIVERAAQYVNSDWKLFHRKDIGTKALLEKRFKQATLSRDIFRYREQRGLIGKNIDWIPGIGKIET
ncbi:MAG: phosphoribosylamine--glycine ligase, partial [Candidatus Methanofastidiosia archaeon]